MHKRVTVDGTEVLTTGVPATAQVDAAQLAQMASCYPDYVLSNDVFDKALYTNTFKQWTPTRRARTR